MAYQGVLVIHRADQGEAEPLNEHQEKHECGCGWWDRRKPGRLPPRVPVGDLPDEYHSDILCLPDGQLIFKPEEWTDAAWEGLLRHILKQYPEHLASIIACHS